MDQNNDFNFQKEELPKPEASKEEEPREVNVIKNMRKGEDTFSVSDENTVVFSDFRPRVVKADNNEVVTPEVPKDLYVPEPVDLLESDPKIEEITDPAVVQTPVPKAPGTASQNASGKQTSSSDPKNGPSEPSA